VAVKLVPFPMVGSIAGATLALSASATGVSDSNRAGLELSRWIYNQCGYSAPLGPREKRPRHDPEEAVRCAIGDENPERATLALTLRQQINSLRKSAQSPNMIQPPSDDTIDLAGKILEQAVETNSPLPSWFMPCVDGGVTVRFGSGAASAVVDFYNSGEIVLAKSRGRDTTTATEVTRDGSTTFRVVEDVRSFLASNHS
jgi:hypothetical protein